MSLQAILYIGAVGFLMSLLIWRVAKAHSRLTGEGAEGRRFSQWDSYPSDTGSSGGHHSDAGGHH